ncbi:MAG TPA: HisA/HisF-related TIM barrel protein [Thermoplasmata archaeon]|nr:HisA/HisF-related TIM barrel protein [Thermoplasmata archaeon]
MSSPADSTDTVLPPTRGAFAIGRGHLYVEDSGSWVPIRGVEILDVADMVEARYRLIYLIDLDGRRKGEPQLDYIQEISRDSDVWVDVGVQRADDAIDALVAGARRAVLSTSMLASERELRRAWKMSTELVLELAVGPEGSVVALEESWAGRPPIEVARALRAIGPDTLVYSPRGPTIDWNLVTELSREGPTWVGGPCQTTDLPAVKGSGAAGAIVWVPATELAPFGVTEADAPL